MKPRFVAQHPRNFNLLAEAYRLAFVKGRLKKKVFSVAGATTPHRPTIAGFTMPQPSTMSAGSSMSQLSATPSQDPTPDFNVMARAIQAIVVLQATTSHSQWIEGLKLGSTFKKDSTFAEQYGFLRATHKRQ